MTRFLELMDECGMSNKGAARRLGVRYDTIKNWRYGKTNPPQGVMDDLTEYAEQAKRIFNNDHT